MKCLLISPLNYIWNINFFLFSFLKYRDFMFFVVSIFVVAKECVVNSKCIFMLFVVFVCHFLVYLSELYWSEFVRAAIFIVLLPFCFAASDLSIYLPAIYLPICLWSYLPKFSKSSFISGSSTIYHNRLLWDSDSNKGFIWTLVGYVDINCDKKLLS